MKVLMISGKSGSGKDTFSQILYNELIKKNKQVLVIHFADLVKYFAKDYYHWNGIKDEHGRALLQQIGTDKMRKYFPKYWAELVGKFLYVAEQSNDFDYVLIPDWRFYNEYEGISDYIDINSITTIRINRTNLNTQLTEQQQQHISECELDNAYFDWILENPTLEDLPYCARTILNHIQMVDYFKSIGENND